MFAIAVLALLAIEFICADELWQRLRERSEERTQSRRATLREKAYKDMDQRWAMRKARQQLWDSVRK